MARAGLALRIRAFLEREGRPVSSWEIASRFLKISGRDEKILVRLLSPTLVRVGVHYTPGLGWRPGRAPVARPAPGAENEVLSEPPAPARQVACAVDFREGRIRGVSVVEVGPPGNRRCIDGARWRSISRLVAGAEVVFADPRAESGPFRMALAGRGLAGPARFRSLSAAVSGAVRIRRGSGPPEIAGALGVPWPDEPGPGDVAECIAGCVERARRLLEARGDGGDAGEPALAGILTGSFLGKVPRTPGVYRFHDAAGDVIYVGKASNLRRRLRSYLTEKRRRVLCGLPEVASIEYAETGSDLQAVLEEAALIRRRRPALNAQREVHRRREPLKQGRARVLLFPAAARGAVTAITMSGGAFAASVRIGPRGGGLARLEKVLKRLLTRHRSEEAANEGLSFEAETSLVNSWLARHGEPSQLDLDSCLGPADAMKRLRRAVEEIRAGDTGEVIHFR